MVSPAEAFGANGADVGFDLDFISVSSTHALHVSWVPTIHVFSSHVWVGHRITRAHDTRPLSSRHDIHVHHGERHRVGHHHRHHAFGHHHTLLEGAHGVRHLRHVSLGSSSHLLGMGLLSNMGLLRSGVHLLWLHGRSGGGRGVLEHRCLPVVCW